MRLGKSGGFVLGVVIVLALAWGVMWVYPQIKLSGYHPIPVKPGEINLIAVQKGAGYRIVVSNATAHLYEVPIGPDGKPEQASFEAPDTGSEDTSETGRLPIRETLRALQGDADALGGLVMSVNKIREEDLPSVRVVWTAEDLKLALSGDRALQTRLERDLNTRIDGLPLESIDKNAIMNGIVIDCPVTVKVPIDGQLKPIVCRVQEAYKTLFAGAIEAIINNKFDITTDSLVGHYRAQAAKLTGPTGRPENVKESILSKVSDAHLGELAVGPERILANTKVLINESQITGASFVPYAGPDRAILSDVTLRLTEDGKMRLWKYSHDNPGFQLLFTHKGIAIAAPRIKTDLAENEVKLTRVPSRDLVKDAVDAINNETGSGSRPGNG